MISKNQIKFVKSLQQKKQRDIHKCFVVESTKNVLEILQSDYEVLHLFATENWLSDYNQDSCFKMLCDFRDSNMTKSVLLSPKINITK